MRWAVVDTPFLLWRAFYGSARFDPAAAERDAVSAALELSESFGAPIWCFDAGPYLRALDLPGYKAKRGEPSGDDEREAAKAALRARFPALVERLRARYGPYRVLHLTGFEADDHAAAVCVAAPRDHELTLVSRDRDLLQLVRPRVRLYDPVTREVWDVKRFRAEYGLHPSQWAEVKALAGCPTDEVPGARGVGEKTAARHLCGTLNQMSAKALAIREFLRTPDFARNLVLCSLPYPGTPPVSPKAFEE